MHIIVADSKMVAAVARVEPTRQGTVKVKFESADNTAYSTCSGDQSTQDEHESVEGTGN